MRRWAIGDWRWAIGDWLLAMGREGDEAIYWFVSER